MQSITLSLPYDLNEQQWSLVNQIFEGMDGWIGFSKTDNTPQWYGDQNSEKYIWASVEPSGLLIEGSLDEALWTGWVSTICARLSLALQSEIRDAEI